MTTSERLYRSLKQDITTCVLLPGTPFSEAELCRRYHASRTPVREACRHLEREGLIKIVSFRGYFVAPLTLAQLHNLHEVQLIVDPAAAGLAALRATPAQLHSMEKCAKYQYRVGVKTSYYAFLQRNFHLHVGIAEASQNADLVAMVTTVQTHLMRFFYLIIAMDAFGVELVQEHEKIVAAIRARNPTEAQHYSAERRLVHDFNGSSIGRTRRGFGVAPELQGRKLWIMGRDPHTDLDSCKSEIIGENGLRAFSGRARQHHSGSGYHWKKASSVARLVFRLDPGFSKIMERSKIVTRLREAA